MSSTSPSGAGAPASSFYLRTMAKMDKFVPPRFMPLWNHPAGPKTVFFWCPLFKWGLVIAGIGDLSRPADKISIPQSASLAATGIIWSRYCMVIIPKNYSLMSVNIFVALTGLYQVGRGLQYQHQLGQEEKDAAVSTADKLQEAS